MSIYEKIKNDKFLALKNKDNIKKDILTVFQGEVTTVAKKNNCEISDDLCNQVLLKIKKSLKETQKIKPSDKTILEIEIIDSYLQKELSIEEIQKIIHENNLNTLNDCFKFFSKNHKGMYDSQVIQSLFKK